MGQGDKGEQGGKIDQYLFDSSAIIALFERKKLDKILRGWSLTLSLYELGNVLWKQVHLHRAVKLEEARLVLDALTSLHSVMKKAAEPNTLKTLETAVKEGLTYYDAAYIHAAEEKGLALVTEDEKLLEAAGKYVRAVKSSQL
jgi:predicted nucleic acid-binding protein